MFLRVMLSCLAISLLSGCATESYQAVTPAKVSTMGTAYHGPKSPISIGKFDNQSSYMRGLFSDGVDRLGGQAKTILVTHLQQSGRFNVLDRTNLDETAKEAELQGNAQVLVGAEFVLTGQVTEFGRKKQIAYAKVSINVVNVLTSSVVYSAQGAGEYALSSREVVGFGGSSSYDSTLNGKVLDLALREAVERLVEGVEAKAWGSEASKQ